MYTYFLTKKRAEQHKRELAQEGILAEVIKKPGKWAVYHSGEPAVDILADGTEDMTAPPEEDENTDQIRDEYLAELRAKNE